MRDIITYCNDLTSVICTCSVSAPPHHETSFSSTVDLEAFVDSMTEQQTATMKCSDKAYEAEQFDRWLKEREAKTEAKRLQAKNERQLLRKQLAEEREAAASRAAALEPKRPIPPNFIPMRCKSMLLSVEYCRWRF